MAGPGQDKTFKNSLLSGGQLMFEDIASTPLLVPFVGQSSGNEVAVENPNNSSNSPALIVPNEDERRDATRRNEESPVALFASTSQTYADPFGAPMLSGPVAFSSGQTEGVELSNYCPPPSQGDFRSFGNGLGSTSEIDLTSPVSSLHSLTSFSPIAGSKILQEPAGIQSQIRQLIPEIPTLPVSEYAQIAQTTNFNFASNVGIEAHGVNLISPGQLPPPPKLPLQSHVSKGGIGRRPVYAQFPDISASVSNPSLVPLVGDLFPQSGRESLSHFSPTQSDQSLASSSNSSIITHYPAGFRENSFTGGSMGAASQSSLTSEGSTMSMSSLALTPVTFHWFYKKKESDGKMTWLPFTMVDSVTLEEAFMNQLPDSDGLVATDGGRYDVNIHLKLKLAVYWEETPMEVRRSSWFYKGALDKRFTPYEEDFSIKLEEEYTEAFRTGVWHKRLEFPGGEAIIFQNPNIVVHFCQAASPDEWGNLPESELRPRVVKRGVDGIDIDDGETSQIDHLVFLIHGIGAICDFKFRSIVEAVDTFRRLGSQMTFTHFKGSLDIGEAGRVEFLPVSWHGALHGENGIDSRLEKITLRSIPVLRHFTNDTLLDILFYTSPQYCQTIQNTVGGEMNRMYNLFLSRNPTFNGLVALAGHSLGSLILFDLLSHQPTIIPVAANGEPKSETHQSGNMPPLNVNNSLVPDSRIVDQPTSSSVGQPGTSAQSEKMVSFTIGPAGTGQPFINYPTLDFHPTVFFAMGSPIAMFVTIRGLERLGEDFHFPTCPAFFNIFHPFDPVAYRMETLIDPFYTERPVVIPHHKGRKRLHLEFKETMMRVGENLRQRVYDSIRSTWQAMTSIASFGRAAAEAEVERIVENYETEVREDEESSTPGEDGEQMPIGKLNGGRRVDYVLQEAPLESFNEYLFALSSHVCYWESEDTMLLVLKEIYGSMGISPDSPGKFPLTTTSTEQPGSSSYASHSSSSHAPVPPYILGTSSLTSTHVPGHTNCTSSQPPHANIPRGPYDAQPNFVPMVSYSASAPNLTSHAPTLFPNEPSGQMAIQPPMNNYGISQIETGVGQLVIGSRPVNAAPTHVGMDPTAPIQEPGAPIAPPPLAGFVRR